MRTMSSNVEVDLVRAPFLVIDELTGEKKEFWMLRQAEIYCKKKMTRTLMERTSIGSYQNTLEVF